MPLPKVEKKEAKQIEKIEMETYEPKPEMMKGDADIKTLFQPIIPKYKHKSRAILMEPINGVKYSRTEVPLETEERKDVLVKKKEVGPPDWM